MSGVVKLDGDPVSGATVTFYSDSGKTFAGNTDASGAFSIISGEKGGIPAGNYKVLVVKMPPMAGASEGMKPGEGDYSKMMEAQKKTMEKNSKTGPGGMRMPMPGGGGYTGPKSELPSIYGSVATTPFSFAVPLQTSPVTLDMKKDKDTKDTKDPKKPK